MSDPSPVQALCVVRCAHSLVSGCLRSSSRPDQAEVAQISNNSWGLPVASRIPVCREVGPAQPYLALPSPAEGSSRAAGLRRNRALRRHRPALASWRGSLQAGPGRGESFPEGLAPAHPVRPVAAARPRAAACSSAQPDLGGSRRGCLGGGAALPCLLSGRHWPALVAPQGP